MSTRFGDMLIDSYVTGSHMTVGGVVHRQDLKIVARRVAANWWRREGHRLLIEDLDDVLAAAPAVLVVGTGFAGGMHVPQETREILLGHGIDVLAAVTPQAVADFNRLASEGKDVAGAFHLTC